MVTTIRPKDYILGSLKIKAENVEASEWLAIVKRAKSICNPYLKYLPGFTPIKGRMNGCPGPSSNHRETDISKVKFFEGFDAESLCIRSPTLSLEKEGRGEIPGHGVRFWSEKELILTRKGELVIWEAEYERGWRHGKGICGYIVETAIFSKFSKVSNDNLLTLFAHYPCLGRDIVNKLWQLVAEGVKERQRRLRDFTEMEKALAGFLERID